MAAYNRGLARRRAAHPVYTPTPQQITAACERIRKGWRSSDKRLDGPPACETQVIADPGGSAF